MPSRPSRNGTPEAPSRQPNKGEAQSSAPFWRVKTLEQMTRGEWEKLCDGCGRCCLVKLEDEDTGDIHKTDIACKLLDSGSCRCIDYPGRQKKVDDCIKLTPKRVRDIPWLPATCAYRLINEGKPLFSWHPLVSGSTETVHTAGISVRGRTRGSEKTVRLRDYVRHIVDWAD